MNISGRKYMSLAETTTYCLSIIVCLVLVAFKMLSVEVFLGIFSGFAAIVLHICNSYFERKDRPEKEIPNGVS